MSASNLHRRRDATGNVVALQLRSPTKDVLIDTGELLYGQHGFNGISLREIAAVAGQRNCNSVQYHFKSKHDFVSAILQDRVLRLDALRTERFVELKRMVPRQSYDARELLKLVWMPDLSIVGPHRIHTYIRFSLQYYLQPGAGAHPFYTRDLQTGRTESTTAGEQSCLFHINNLLQRYFHHIPLQTFHRRFIALSMMYQCSVVEYDNEQAMGTRKKRPPYDIEAIIDMAIGALSASD